MKVPLSDTDSFQILSERELIHGLELTANSVFTDPRIKVWRSLSDRENATLDHVRPDGSMIRLHVKRYPPAAGAMARRELAGFKLLKTANVPAAEIVASGSRADGSSFILLQDLAGYTPADKLLEQGFPFDRLLNPTADLAAGLHAKRLHHRDLYLCHFMIASDEMPLQAKLIDMARVARMKSILTRRRWIVKDLAQFWFSTFGVGVTNAQRNAWLERYCVSRQISDIGLKRSIEHKAAAIARHDIQLRRTQPWRNVSIEK